MTHNEPTQVSFDTTNPQVSPFNLKEVYDEITKVLEEKKERKQKLVKSSSKVYYYIPCDTNKLEVETLLFEKFGLKSRATIKEKSSFINIYKTINEDEFEEISKTIIENINHTPPSGGIYYFYCKLNNPQISSKTYDYKTSFLVKDTCEKARDKPQFCDDSD